MVNNPHENREAGALYRLASNLMSDYVFKLDVAPDGNVEMVFASETFERDTGGTPDVSKTPDLWTQIIHPEDIEKVNALLRQLIADGGSGALECRSCVKDGRMRWVHVSAQAIRDSEASGTTVIAGTVKDITDQKRMEEALRESELRLNNLADHLPNAMVYQGMATPEGGRKFNYVGRGVERLNEITVEEILADPGTLYRQFLPEYRTRVAKVEREALENLTPLRVEVKSQLPSGRERWFEFVSTPRYLSDGQLVWDGVEVDITERKEAEALLEQRVAERTAELEAANRRLQCEIEERRRAEKSSSESQERYRALFDQAMDGIMIMSVDGKRLIVNAAFAQMHGYTSPEEMQGITLWDLDTPKSAAEAEERLHRIMAGEAMTFEVWHYRKDGSTFPLHVSCNVIEFGGERYFLGFHQDISAYKQAEAALWESEEKYRGIFDESVAAILLFDKDKNFIDLNKAGLDLLGYSRDELLRMRITDLDADPVVVLPALEQLLSAGRLVNYEHQLRRKDGTIITVLTNSRPLTDVTGNVIGMLSTLVDITDQKQAEAARQYLEAQVQHAQKLESLGVLAGGIAHDFNNILHLILGNAHHALRVISEVSPARPFVDNIERSANRAADLTRQMLAYAGKARFSLRVMDIGEIVREISHLLHSSVPKKVVLELNLAEDLPPVEVDAAQIQQVVMNLILNASEALDEERGGRVTVSTRALHCTADLLRRSRTLEQVEEGDFACLEVADTGCGMNDETLERLFDPFFTTKFSGRGLGLSAVLGIVRAHRGAILVESALGKGTTIRVLVPAVERAVSVVTKAVPERSPSPSNTKASILFVDDEPDMLELGAMTIEQMGYTAVTAADGLDAIDIFKTRYGEIDCVLLDLSMPRMNGVETLAELRRIKPDVKVILASGYAEQELEARLAGQQVGALIEKPYDFATLSEKLQRILGR